MSILKKLFGTLSQKPWEENQAAIDSTHSGRTFNLSNQMSAVIIIFGVSTAIFSLIFSGYLYSLPPEQDTTFILKTYLLWVNTLVLIFVTFFFNKISSDLKKNLTNKIKQNLIYVGGLSYLFLFLQLILWYHYEEWIFCRYKYVLFIFLYFYCTAWNSSSWRSVLLGKSKFKNFQIK